MDANQDKIFWKGSIEDNIRARFINISEIIDIYAGINATSVMKKNKVPMDFNHLCFSLITKKRF